jgi:hypothetical protein
MKENVSWPDSGLPPITLTVRYRFNTNVAITEAFKNIYTLATVNPSILAELRHVR